MRWIFSIALLLLGGCADIGYYWHSASGHLGLMNKRVDIDDLLADEQLETGLRTRLQLVLEIRRFASARLALPDNDSYLSYVELERPYVLQNLFAAPEFSTRLHSWCYPIVGCASYRGYYDDDRLQEYVVKLRAEGLEVHIGRVSAYSTLGWFDDPVLSSFINWPDYRLAGLMFHELTHQQIYVDDDTRFNESLASAVQQAGTELWLQAQNRDADLGRFHRWLSYREKVIALIETTRLELETLYQSDLGDARKRADKAELFVRARALHASIAAEYEITGGYSNWFAEELNNAKIGSVAAYHSAVPAFIAMLEAKDGDFSRFYAYVEKIGELDKPRRDACLEAWKKSPQVPDCA